MQYVYDYSWILQYAPELLRGLGVTLALTAGGVSIGLILGLCLAFIRSRKPNKFHMLIVAYVELIRNTPYMIQLFFVFFGLPQAGIKIDAMTAALLGTALNVTAYSSEIFRAGIQSIPRGQIEAAQSLALSPVQTFRYVILAPALQKMWPALSSQVVIIMLGTSVVSQIAVEDLTFVASFIQSRNFRSFETYIFLLLVYLVVAFLMRWGLTLLGQKIFSRRAGRV